VVVGGGGAAPPGARGRPNDTLYGKATP